MLGWIETTRLFKPINSKITKRSNPSSSPVIYIYEWSSILLLNKNVLTKSLETRKWGYWVYTKKTLSVWQKKICYLLAYNLLVYWRIS